MRERTTPSGKERRENLLTLLLGVFWSLPLWVVTYPPMLDYPQHLAMSRIVQRINDSEWGFDALYRLDLSKPNALFEYLVAVLGIALPINMAGKLVLTFTLLGTGYAGLRFCRHMGRPWWMGLLGFPFFYSHIYYWGFVGTLMAIPLLLLAWIYVDRLMEEGMNPGSAAIFLLLSLGFYPIHLQFAFLFAGGTVWLFLCNWKGIREFALCSVPITAGALFCYFLSRITLAQPGAFERGMMAESSFTPLGARLSALSGLLFGDHREHSDAIVSLLCILLAGVAALGAQRIYSGISTKRLYSHRFLFLGFWIFGLYFVLPLNIGQYLIQERLAPLAGLMVLLALPKQAGRFERWSQLLVASILVVQFSSITTSSLIFEDEASGIEDVLEITEPGKKLMGLVLRPKSATLLGPDVYLHFPAIYQSLKGGQVAFSFAELVHSVVRPIEGQSLDTLLLEVNPREPENFRFKRHAKAFDYFLVRGTPREVQALFGPHLSGLKIKSAGFWHLLW